jgi:CRP/FNR family cyclic AMP-dependent transcriptional regulator
VQTMNKFMRVFRSSEVIFHEETHGDEMYIICEGNVRLTTKAEGREEVLGVLSPGDFFGEMALVDATPRSATATAVDDVTQVIVLDQTKFLYLVAQQPPFALYIMHGLCRRLKERWAAHSELLRKTGGTLT